MAVRSRSLSFKFLALAFLLAFAGSFEVGAPMAHAGGMRAVSWNALVDPVKGRFEDPFDALSSSQLRSLGIVLQARQALKGDGLNAAERRQVQSELDRHEGLLQVAGVDADALLSQREEVALKKAAASLATNPALDGEEVALKGFVIPLFSETGKDLGGYFVPQAGMCSHLPPPPPNQLIYYPPGSGWEGAYVYQPVELQGRLKGKVARQEISLLDGRIEMISAWQMTVDTATVLDSSEPDPQQRSFNLFSRMKKFLTRGGTSELPQ